MAVSDNATVVPGKGFYYVAPVGSTAPTDPLAPTTPWINVGHTGREEPFTVNREGGDRTTLGSWQNEALRERVEPISYRVAFRLLQYDELSAQLYYGGGAVDDTSGRFQAPKTAVPQEHALLVVIVDGANTIDFHFPKTSILGSDSQEGSVENLANMPVGATILGDSALDYLFSLDSPGMASTTV